MKDRLPEVAKLVEALEELVDLMEDTYQGEYIPDSLTTQPARAALAAYRAREEYTLDEAVGDVVLSDWARWVTVDANGEVWEYAKKPTVTNEMWNYLESGRLRYIGRVSPPRDFKSCIWEIGVKQWTET